MKKKQLRQLWRFALTFRKLIMVFNLFFFIVCSSIINVNANNNLLVNGNQQEKILKGTIKDQNGTPIPGVTILIKGSTKGTISDLDGIFTLNVDDNAKELILKYIGFKTLEIPIGSQTTFDLVMEEDIIGLDEVVAVGYGTMRKVDITGAVSSVKGDKIAEAGVFSAAQAMQGKVSGVAITNAGDAGASPKIRIRGIKTITNNEPLVVIDGITNGAGLDDINPSDIESIDVLKDASALAIYGSRASNGVILVTTKKGNYGEKLEVTFNASYGVSQINKRLDLVSASELVDIIDEARLTENTQLNGKYKLYDEFWPNDNWGRQDITDWQDELFNTGIVQDYTISATGGSKQFTSAFSVSYRDQEGTMPGSFAKRMVVRGSMEGKVLNDKLTLGVTINYSTRESDGTDQGDIWKADLFRAAQVPGNIPAYDSLGFPYQETDKKKIDYFMPGDLYQNQVHIYDDYMGPKHNVADMFYADLEIIKGLNFKSNLGLNYDQDYTRKYTHASDNPQGGDSFLSESSRRNSSYSWDNTLTYNKTIGAIKFNVMGGTSILNGNSNNFNASRSDFPDGDPEALRYFDFANPGTQLNDDGASNYRLASYFGRVNFNYNEKYLLTATVRKDGSSRFHKDARWGVFPSFSVGWRISEESFLNSVSWLDLLKIRASWGQVGNQNVGRDYAYVSSVKSGFVSSWESGDTDHVFGEPAARQTGKVIYERGNESLTWETTAMTNIGFDYAFLGSFNGSFEVYNNNTSGMLLPRRFPEFVGYFPNTAVRVNSGEVQTKGFEFSINYQKQISSFAYSVGANLSYSQNELVSMSDLSFLDFADRDFKGLAMPMSRSYVGDPIGAFYGWQTQGIFNTQEEVNAMNQNYRDKLMAADPTLDTNDVKNKYYIDPRTGPGDYIFEDVNGDGKITEEDKKYLGQGNPKYQFGINFSCNYKNFDLAVNMTGVTGVTIYSMFEPPMSIPGGFASLASMKDHWTPENHTDNYPRYTMKDPNKNLRPSDKWLHDGTYLRVQNIIFGYSLPNALVTKIGLGSLRFYVNAQNVLTFSKYPFIEPEVQGNSTMGGNLDTGAGIDVGVAPVPTTIMFGVNAKF